MTLEKVRHTRYFDVVELVGLEFGLLLGLGLFEWVGSVGCSWQCSWFGKPFHNWHTSASNVWQYLTLTFRLILNDWKFAKIMIEIWDIEGKSLTLWTGKLWRRMIRWEQRQRPGNAQNPNYRRTPENWLMCWVVVFAVGMLLITPRNRFSDPQTIFEFGTTSNTWLTLRWFRPLCFFYSNTSKKYHLFCYFGLYSTNQSGLKKSKRPWIFKSNVTFSSMALVDQNSINTMHQQHNDHSRGFS